MLGCGAIGGTVAAGLVRDGHDVLICDADPAVVAAINDDGLRIEGPVEQFTARPDAISPGALPDRIDFPVLVACKQHHTAAAAALLAGRLAGEAFVVSLQNGLPSPALAAAAGSGRVVQACVNFGADVLAPGVVMRGNRGTFKIGEIDGTPSARIDALAADIADAEATTEVMGFVWGKEAYGAMLFATAVSDLAIHEVFDNPAYHPLLLAVASEVLGQAPVRPLPLDGFDPDDLTGSLPRLADFNRRSGKSHSGIYRDLAIRRRKTETEAILGPLRGFLIRRTAELIAAIEAGTRTCCQQNLDLLAAYERLDRLGRPLNAVVSVAGAPRRAAAGPLSGRPVVVKDIIAVAGLPTRCGSPATSSAPATEDAALVGRLRAAGAEVFATAQCLEFAAGYANPRVGDTRNPARSGQDLRRLIGRVGRSGRRGRLRPGDRHRHRRLDPNPRRLLRCRGPQADLRPRAHERGVPAVAEPGPRGDAHRDGRRRHCPAASYLGPPAGRLLSAFRSSACCRPSSPTRQ